MKIFVSIVLLFLIFERATRKYLNPYKLIMIFGKKGSGKTTNLTKIAIQHIKAGWIVYSTIDIPGTIKFNVNDVGYKVFPEHSVVLIDEVGMIWDNRDFKSFKPQVRDYFKFQRQYKNKVYLFSQTFDIDLKLRNLTDEMWLLTNVGRVFSLQKRIIKKITINNASENSGGVSSLVDEYKFDSPLFGGWKITFIPRWVAFFKSYDPKKLAVIEGEYLDRNELQEAYMKTRNWLFDSCKIAFLNVVYKIKGGKNRHLKNPFKKKKSNISLMSSRGAADSAN